MAKKIDRRLLSARGSALATEAERHLSACSATFSGHIPGLLDALFSKLDDVLYNLADKSENNKLFATYFDAMRVFRRRRAEIVSLFLGDLFDSGATKGGIGTTLTVRDALERAPREDEELEETLAVSNLVSKAENRYRAELTELRRHLAVLSGRARVSSRNDPFGPHRLCNAFRQALRPVEEVDITIKLVVYKLFDKQVMDQLGSIYARCRAHAATQLLASDTGLGRLASEMTGSKAPAGAPDAQPPAAKLDSDDATARTSDVAGPDRTVDFHDLQRLLGQRKRSEPGHEKRVVLDTNEVMLALSRIQQSEGIETDSWELRRQLSDYLRLRTGSGPPRVLRRSDEDTLDLVFLLFEHVLQGNDIPDPLKVLIGRLQTPIAKLALVDKSFFEDKHHPARRLLNHLAQVAVGCTDYGDYGDRSPSSVYGRIERVIGEILTRGGGNPATFAEIDAALCSSLAREQEEARSQEAKARQDPSFPEQQHSAKRLVRMAIAQRLRGYGPVPDGVASLLYEGWQQVLLAAYLRDGTEGAQWHDAMAIIDHLVWSVQPKSAYKERRELLRSIPSLLSTLRRSLAEVSYDQRRLARWFKELQRLHIAALRGAETAPAQSDRGSQPVAMRASRSPKALVNGKGTEQGSATSAPRSEVPGLETGAWIEVRRKRGGLSRVKLAWRSPQSGVYLFVDRHGHKVLELAGEDILKLERRGTLTVLGDTPIVDRAIRELVQTLKSESGT